MGRVENEQFVETFISGCSDRPLGESVRIRSAHWREDDMDTLGHKDRIEALSEFGIIIANQKVNARRASFEVPDRLTCLLVDPGRGWVLGTAREVYATAAQLNKEEYVQRL